MYITKVRLNGASDVDLPIVGANPADTFIMKGADGLGPPEVVVTITNGVYQNSKPADRQIVVRVGLNANYGVNQTSEQLRTTLYGLLMPNFATPLKVELMNGSLVVATVDGYISKMEPAIFSKDPEVQITINCVGSYLYAPDPLVVVPGTKATFDVPNIGSAPVGFELYVDLTGSPTTLRISRTSNPAEFFEINYPNLIPGDDIIINTREDSRAAYSDGVNYIGYRHPGSTWLQLYPGVNNFTMNTTAFNWGSITFTPQYWGL